MNTKTFSALILAAAISFSGVRTYSQAEASKTQTPTAGNGTTTGAAITATTAPRGSGTCGACSAGWREV